MEGIGFYCNSYKGGMHVSLTWMMQGIYDHTIKGIQERLQSQDNIRQPQDLSGMGFLSIFMLRSAFDPRDKIFALNNVFKSMAIATPLPDYTKDTQSIFEEATITYIRGFNSLKVLEFVCTINRMDGLPSWVPDFTSNGHIVEETGSTITTTETLQQSRISFSSHSYPIHEPGKLILKGKTLLVIHRASGNMPVVMRDCIFQALHDRSHMEKILFKIFAWSYIIRTTLNFPSSKDKMLHIFISLTMTSSKKEIQVFKDIIEGPITITILANSLLDLQEGQQLDLETFKSAFQDFRESFNRMPATTRSAIYVVMLRFGSGKALFLSDSGRHGFTRGHIQVNDLVVLLYGSILPMILRPKDGCYQLIGPALVSELGGELPNDQEVNINNYVLI